ncbi:MAG: hypothetical protein R3F61_10940 [Myxococcota bacterium]
MFAALSIAFASPGPTDRPPALRERPGEPPALELAALPVYRGASSDIADSTGSSSAGDGHYGVRLRVSGHLRPWLSVHLDATQTLLNLWFETEREMQRYGRLRLTSGPSWTPLTMRVRAGIGQEGVLAGASFAGPRRYAFTNVLEAGGELSLRGPLARLTIGATVFGWPGLPAGRSVDVELAVPQESVVGGVIAYDHRALDGTFDLGTGDFVLSDRNHTVGVGLVVRPRMRSAPEE